MVTTSGGVPRDAPTLVEKVAEVLYQLYALGPRGRLSAVMLREYFAPRVAAAIEAMGQTWPEGDNNDGALPLSHEQRQAAALAALAGGAGGGEQK